MVRNFMMPLLVLTACVSQGLAGPFSKPNKPDPAEYVPALIQTLQTDADERKREHAAEELRDYDVRAFPDMMPALIEALKNDPSSSVRHEVANTIAKLRPFTQAAGFALEQAAAKDNSTRVRVSARASLVHLTLLGIYRTGRNPETIQNQTEEPPLAIPLPKSGTNPKMGAIIPATMVPKETTETGRPVPPPLMPTPSKTTSRPLFPLFSSKSNKPEPKDEGPVLNPPK